MNSNQTDTPRVSIGGKFIGDSWLGTPSKLDNQDHLSILKFAFEGARECNNLTHTSQSRAQSAQRLAELHTLNLKEACDSEKRTRKQLLFGLITAYVITEGQNYCVQKHEGGNAITIKQARQVLDTLYLNEDTKQQIVQLTQYHLIPQQNKRSSAIFTQAEHQLILRSSNLFSAAAAVNTSVNNLNLLEPGAAAAASEAETMFSVAWPEKKYAFRVVLLPKSIDLFLDANGRIDFRAMQVDKDQIFAVYFESIFALHRMLNFQFLFSKRDILFDSRKLFHKAANRFRAAVASRFQNLIFCNAIIKKSFKPGNNLKKDEKGIDQQSQLLQQQQQQTAIFNSIINSNPKRTQPGERSSNRGSLLQNRSSLGEIAEQYNLEQDTDSRKDIDSIRSRKSSGISEKSPLQSKKGSRKGSEADLAAKTTSSPSIAIVPVDAAIGTPAQSSVPAASTAINSPSIPSLIIAPTFGKKTGAKSPPLNMQSFDSASKQYSTEVIQYEQPESPVIKIKRLRDTSSGSPPLNESQLNTSGDTETHSESSPTKLRGNILKLSAVPVSSQSSSALQNSNDQANKNTNRPFSLLSGINPNRLQNAQQQQQQNQISSINPSEKTMNSSTQSKQYPQNNLQQGFEEAASPLMNRSTSKPTNENNEYIMNDSSSLSSPPILKMYADLNQNSASPNQGNVVGAATAVGGTYDSGASSSLGSQIPNQFDQSSPYMKGVDNQLNNQRKYNTNTIDSRSQNFVESIRAAGAARSSDSSIPISQINAFLLSQENQNSSNNKNNNFVLPDGRTEEFKDHTFELGNNPPYSSQSQNDMQNQSYDYKSQQQQQPYYVQQNSNQRSQDPEFYEENYQLDFNAPVSQNPSSSETNYQSNGTTVDNKQQSGIEEFTGELTSLIICNQKYSLRERNSQVQNRISGSKNIWTIENIQLPIPIKPSNNSADNSWSICLANSQSNPILSGSVTLSLLNEQKFSQFKSQIQNSAEQQLIDFGKEIFIQLQPAHQKQSLLSRQNMNQSFPYTVIVQLILDNTLEPFNTGYLNARRRWISTQDHFLYPLIQNKYVAIPRKWTIQEDQLRVKSQQQQYGLQGNLEYRRNYLKALSDERDNILLEWLANVQARSLVNTFAIKNQFENLRDLPSAAQFARQTGIPSAYRMCVYGLFVDMVEIQTNAMQVLEKNFSTQTIETAKQNVLTDRKYSNMKFNQQQYDLQKPPVLSAFEILKRISIDYCNSQIVSMANVVNAFFAKRTPINIESIQIKENVILTVRAYLLLAQIAEQQQQQQQSEEEFGKQFSIDAASISIIVNFFENFSYDSESGEILSINLQNTLKSRNNNNLRSNVQKQQPQVQSSVVHAKMKPVAIGNSAKAIALKSALKRPARETYEDERFASLTVLLRFVRKINPAFVHWATLYRIRIINPTRINNFIFQESVSANQFETIYSGSLSIFANILVGEMWNRVIDFVLSMIYLSENSQSNSAQKTDNANTIMLSISLAILETYLLDTSSEQSPEQETKSTHYLQAYFATYLDFDGFFSRMRSIFDREEHFFTQSQKIYSQHINEAIKLSPYSPSYKNRQTTPNKNQESPQQQLDAEIQQLLLSNHALESQNSNLESQRIDILISTDMLPHDILASSPILSIAISSSPTLLLPPANNINSTNPINNEQEVQFEFTIKGNNNNNNNGINSSNLLSSQTSQLNRSQQSLVQQSQQIKLQQQQSAQSTVFRVSISYPTNATLGGTFITLSLRPGEHYIPSIHETPFEFTGSIYWDPSLIFNNKFSVSLFETGHGLSPQENRGSFLNTNTQPIVNQLKGVNKQEMQGSYRNISPSQRSPISVSGITVNKLNRSIISSTPANPQKNCFDITRFVFVNVLMTPTNNGQSLPTLLPIINYSNTSISSQLPTIDLLSSYDFKSNQLSFTQATPAPHSPSTIFQQENQIRLSQHQQKSQLNELEKRQQSNNGILKQQPQQLVWLNSKIERIIRMIACQPKQSLTGKIRSLFLILSTGFGENFCLKYLIFILLEILRSMQVYTFTFESILEYIGSLIGSTALIRDIEFEVRWSNAAVDPESIPITRVNRIQEAFEIANLYSRVLRDSFLRGGYDIIDIRLLVERVHAQSGILQSISATVGNSNSNSVVYDLVIRSDSNVILKYTINAAGVILSGEKGNTAANLVPSMFTSIQLYKNITLFPQMFEKIVISIPWLVDYLNRAPCGLDFFMKVPSLYLDIQIEEKNATAVAAGNNRSQFNPRVVSTQMRDLEEFQLLDSVRFIVLKVLGEKRFATISNITCSVTEVNGKMLLNEFLIDVDDILLNQIDLKKHGDSQMNMQGTSSHFDAKSCVRVSLNVSISSHNQNEQQHPLILGRSQQNTVQDSEKYKQDYLLGDKGVREENNMNQQFEAIIFTPLASRVAILKPIENVEDQYDIDGLKFIVPSTHMYRF